MRRELETHEQPVREDAGPFPDGSPQREKLLIITDGTDTAYQLAIEHGLKFAWGSDVLFNPRLARRQASLVAKMTRWFTAPEVMTMVTPTNAELLALSGPRNPYPGQLGMVAEGALAACCWSTASR